MSRIEPRVLKGFRDILPEQELVRRRLTEALETAFRRFGFVPIDTPVLEYTEVLLGKGSGETDKQIYRFTDHGNRDVSMRFDLTVPFARFMAAHLTELYIPFRRYHIGKAYRGENTQRGRYREFIQCDFDIVGTAAVGADIDIVLTVAEAFRVLGVPDIEIHLAHRGLFNRFLDKLGVREKSEDVLRTVDKLRKVGEEQTSAALSTIVGESAAVEVLRYITATGSFTGVLETITGLAGGMDEDGRRLAAVYQAAEAVGLSGIVRLDPSITRGLDYYTGIVFETFLSDLPSIGSVCSGGRYDDLAGIYSKQQIPGVGGSVGLDRLLAALDELNVAPAAPRGTDVVVFCLDSSLTGYYQRIAATLRKYGISCEVYPEAKKLGVQFSFAEKKNIPIAIICGENERDAGTVNGKDLRTRTEFTATDADEAATRIKHLLEDE